MSEIILSQMLPNENHSSVNRPLLWNILLFCTKKFNYENKSSSKQAGIFILISRNIPSPQQRSFQSLPVRGFWESSLLIPSPSLFPSLLPHYLLEVMFASQKDTELLSGPEEVGQDHTQRTNFGSKCLGKHHLEGGLITHIFS